MAQRTETFWRCDRCGHEEPCDLGIPNRWGRIAAERWDSRDRIGGEGLHTDLCGGCIDALMEWWRTPNGPLMQPAPPPPPPPPTFTLEHHRIAVADAARLIADQVGAAFEVVRQEPTSILSETIVPGALAGVDDRARELVDAIIERLGLNRRRRSRQSEERHDAPLPDPADAPAMPAAAPIPASPGAPL